MRKGLNLTGTLSCGARSGRKPRDAQRSKVYRAGWAMQRSVAGAAELLTERQANAYLHGIWQAAGYGDTPTPLVTVTRRRNGTAASNGATIKVAPALMTRQVITHEGTHSALRLTNKEAWRTYASHGPEFCATWLAMLSAGDATDRAMGDELRKQFATHRVNTGARTGRPHGAPGSGTSVAAAIYVLGATQPLMAIDKAPAPGWSAAQELARRKTNRAAKRSGGAKVEFPQGARPALFKASAAELREMS